MPVISEAKREDMRGAAGQKKVRGRALRRKRNYTTPILMLLLIIGLGLILYPSVSDYWNSFHQSRAIAGYVEQVANIDNSRSEAMWKLAESYNDRLLGKEERYILSDEEMQEYNETLDVTGTGIMGYIEVPQLKISLPVYHGVEESVLQIAIGHIPGTSLPVGGTSSHSVLSGHRGLPSAKLFSDIDRMDKGDTFLLQILNRTLTYEVDQIRIVLPYELQDLEILPGGDYVTLVTCTPYGVNTHRLLVRGHRIANARDEVRVNADALQIDTNIVSLALASSMVLFLLVLMMLQSLVRFVRRLFR